MKKLYITIIIAIVALNANAQVPGYLGKKHVIMAEGTIGPAFPFFRWYPSGLSRRIYPGYSFGINYEYAAGRKTTIGLKYAYSGYKFSQSSYQYPFSEDYWNAATPPLYKLAPMALNSSSIIFSYKNFGTMLPAPIGRYFELNAGVAILSARDIEGLLQRSDGSLKAGHFTSSIQPVFGLGFGTQRIILKRMIFNLGMNFSVYPGIFFKKNGKNVEDYYKTGNMVDPVKFKVNAIGGNAVFIRFVVSFGTVL